MSDRDKYNLSYTWNLTHTHTHTEQTQLTDREQIGGHQRWGWEVGETGEGDRKAHTPGSEMRKSWGWNVQHGGYM